MMNFTKLTALAISYKDGNDDIQTAKKSLRESKIDRFNKLGEIYYRIEKLPNIGDFFCYMFYCGGTVSGPFFEYNDFNTFIEKKGHYKVIPNSILPTLKRVA